MAKLYFNRTLLTEDGLQSHINPLLLSRYKVEELIIFIAREPQRKRLEKIDINQLILGWWEIEDWITKDSLAAPEDAGSFTADKWKESLETIIKSYQAVVIIDEDRIHKKYHYLLDVVKSSCSN